MTTMRRVTASAIGATAVFTMSYAVQLGVFLRNLLNSWHVGVVMPLYRFVIRDGEEWTELVDLPDAAAVRREAAQRVGRLSASQPDELWRQGALLLQVQDAAGLVLFTIDVVATIAPASARPFD